MASKKISDLTDFTSLYDLEVFPDGAFVPVVNDGVTLKLSLENLLSKTLRTDKASEISSVTSKSVSVNNDFIMLEDSSTNEKRSCTKSQFLHDVPQIQTGSTNPGSTPSKVGLIYIDTVHCSVFIAIGISSPDDWKLINLSE